MTDETPETHGRRVTRAPREHLLGRRGTAGDTLVLVFGGVHGNEQAGVAAMQRVLAQLEDDGVEVSGEVCFFAGNLQALSLGQRYVEDDLNRIWFDDAIEGARAAASAAELTAERRELRELLDALEAELERAGERQVVFFDLHSTSAPGAPFVVMGDTLENRRIALGLDAPVLLGIEENVEGTMLSWFGEQGYAAVGFEGGRHGDPETALNHEAAIWLALESLSMLDGKAAEHVVEGRKRLARASRGLPRFVAVTHRHAVAREDEFRMREGYVNFDTVTKGEHLADDRTGRVLAPFGGRILLPLYQGQGSDGFFLGRRVRGLWLGLSALLRRLRLERALPLLPGVRRDPDVPDGLLVDRRIARLHALDVFHLLGYWKRGEEGTTLRVTRRREGRRR